MQRWGFLLSAYPLNLIQQSHTQMLTGYVSRLLVPNNLAIENPHYVTLSNVSQIVSLPVTEVHIQTATQKDAILGAVCRQQFQNICNHT